MRLRSKAKRQSEAEVEPKEMFKVLVRYIDNEVEARGHNQQRHVRHDDITVDSSPAW